ncbi:hypothetical protein WA171_003209 [Blastocystis sp. BT1]
MEEVSEPNSPLNSCLKLLRSEGDEQKIAGMLLASRHLKPIDSTDPTVIKRNQENASAIFNAVGLPFLEKMMKTPIQDAYDSSYCCVALSFILNFCDIPELQVKIVQLIVPLLQVLKESKDLQQRTDLLHILSSLWNNTTLRPIICNHIVILSLLSSCSTLVNEVTVELQEKYLESKKESKEKHSESKKESKEKHSESKIELLLKQYIAFINLLIQSYSSEASLPLILVSLSKIACMAPALYMYSLLPSLSSILMSHSLPQQLGVPANKHAEHQILFFSHWLIARCFIYKTPAESRIFVFEFLWSVVNVLQFRWLSLPLQASKDLGVPEKECALSDSKLIYLLMKTSSIEIRVQLDYLYKDVVSVYETDGESATKDKDRSEISNSLNTLFICIQIVCSVMKEVGESVDTENAFSSFDYDEVVALSTAWAESLRCIKEYVTLALGITRTDM